MQRVWIKNCRYLSYSKMQNDYILCSFHQCVHLPFSSLEQAVPHDFAVLAKTPPGDAREGEVHKRWLCNYWWQSAWQHGALCKIWGQHHILLYRAHDFALFSNSGKTILNNSTTTEYLIKVYLSTVHSTCNLLLLSSLLLSSSLYLSLY